MLLIIGARYNEYNVEEVVGNFIEMVKNERLEERFNLFLSSRQIDYLESVAKKRGLNKSEYIRMLIDDDRK